MSKQYWMNADTGRVMARDFDDPPFGNLWIEIDEQEYKQLEYPLTPPESCVGLDPIRCDDPKCLVHGKPT